MSQVKNLQKENLKLKGEISAVNSEKKERLIPCEPIINLSRKTKIHR